MHQIQQLEANSFTIQTIFKLETRIQSLQCWTFATGRGPPLPLVVSNLLALKAEFAATAIRFFVTAQTISSYSTFLSWVNWETSAFIAVFFSDKWLRACSHFVEVHLHVKRSVVASLAMSNHYIYPFWLPVFVSPPPCPPFSNPFRWMLS